MCWAGQSEKSTHSTLSGDRCRTSDRVSPTRRRPRAAPARRPGECLDSSPARLSGPLENSHLPDRVEHVSRSTYFDRTRTLEALSLANRNRQADVPPVAEPSAYRFRCTATPRRGPSQRRGWLAPRRAHFGSPTPPPRRSSNAGCRRGLDAVALPRGAATLTPRSWRIYWFTASAIASLSRAARNLVKAGLAERVAVRPDSATTRATAPAHHGQQAAGGRNPLGANTRFPSSSIGHLGRDRGRFVARVAADRGVRQCQRRPRTPVDAARSPQRKAWAGPSCV